MKLKEIDKILIFLALLLFTGINYSCKKEDPLAEKKIYIDTTDNNDTITPPLPQQFFRINKITSYCYNHYQYFNYVENNLTSSFVLKNIDYVNNNIIFDTLEKIEYTYPANNILQSTTFYRCNDEYQIVKKNIIELNEAGKRKKSTVYQYIDGIERIEKNDRFDYDTRNHLIQWTHESNINGSLQATWKECYTYNTFGIDKAYWFEYNNGWDSTNIIQYYCTLTTIDSLISLTKTEQWQYQTKLVFKYSTINDTTIISKIKYYDYDLINNSWSEIFEINYDTDEYGNVTSITNSFPDNTQYHYEEGKGNYKNFYPSIFFVDEQYFNPLNQKNESPYDFIRKALKFN